MRFTAYHHLMPSVVTMSKNVLHHVQLRQKKISDNGDLDHELPNGYTVGQELCIGLNNGHGIDNCFREPVYVYSNTCDGPWIWDGLTTLQELCCHEGRHHDCDTLPPPPPQ